MRRIFLGLILITEMAHADVSITKRVLQDGVFNIVPCKATAVRTQHADECLCQAKLNYPVINGIGNKSAEKKLNSQFKEMANQEKCEGKLSSKVPYSDWNGFIGYTRDIRFKTTFKSPEVISIYSDLFAFNPGAAHGSSHSYSSIIDVKIGQILSVNNVFGNNTPQVNDYIYNNLLYGLWKGKKAEFLDWILDFGEAHEFIKNDKCDGCLLSLAKDGVEVQFAEYVVAPYSEGKPSVLIPREYIASLLILSALDNNPQNKLELSRAGKLSDYKQAINEIKKSSVFNQANADTLAAINQTAGNIVEWRGILTKIHTTHGGKTVDVSILSKQNNVEYKNGSDINAGTPLYKQLSELREDEEIVFSGTLVKKFSGENEGYEGSVTEQGSLENPIFYVNFKSINAAE